MGDVGQFRSDLRSGDYVHVVTRIFLWLLIFGSLVFLFSSFVSARVLINGHDFFDLDSSINSTTYITNNFTYDDTAIQGRIDAVNSSLSNYYLASNPSGFITSSALAPYLLITDQRYNDSLAIGYVNSTSLKNFGDQTLFGSLTVVGDLSVVGSVVNFTVVNQLINGSILPSISGLFDIGSPSEVWNNVYANNVFNVSKINFNLNPVVNASIGDLYFDVADKVLAFKGESWTLQIGQEMYGIVYNDKGYAIPDSSIVYIDGATGDFPTVAFADASDISTGYVLGIATQTILSGETGMITLDGVVHGLNTSLWSAGTILYLSDSVAGSFTDVKPLAPSYAIAVSTVLNSDEFDGSMFVRTRTAEVDPVWESEKDNYYNKSFVDTIISRQSNRYAGFKSVPIIVDNGDGSVNFSSSVVVLYNNSNYSGYPIMFDLVSGRTGVAGVNAIPDGVISYLVAEYNGGSPIIQLITNPDLIHDSDVVPVLSISRSGNELYLLEWGNSGNGMPEKLSDRLVRTERYAIETGLELGEGVNNTLTVSSGILWYGVNRLLLNSTDTSVDGLDVYYHNSSGDYVKVNIVNGSYYNDVWDNGTGLISLDNGTYANIWVYRNVMSAPEVDVIVGHAQYSSISEALLGQPPSVLPFTIYDNYVLIGRITFLSGASSGIVGNFNSISFGDSGIVSHNDLSNIQGGSIGEFYHLSFIQYQDVVDLPTSLSIFNVSLNDEILARVGNDSFLQSQIDNISINTSLFALNSSLSNYYLVSNPFGFLNASGVVSAVGNFSSVNLSLARVGNCSVGMVVQNISSSGVECIVPPVIAKNYISTYNVSASTLSMVAQNVWYNITGMNLYGAVGWSVINTSNVSTINCNVSGIYQVTYMLTGSPDNNDVIKLQIVVNGVAVDRSLIAHRLNTNLVQTVDLHYIQNFTQGDNVTIQLRDTSRNNAIYSYTNSELVIVEI